MPTLEIPEGTKLLQCVVRQNTEVNIDMSMDKKATVHVEGRDDVTLVDSAAGKAILVIPEDDIHDTFSIFNQNGQRVYGKRINVGNVRKKRAGGDSEKLRIFINVPAGIKVNIITK